MNNTIFYDSEVSDDIRRQQLYDGQLFAYSTRPSILGLVNFAKSMIEDTFGGMDPRMAQKHMAVERYAELLGKLKPAFIHHPELKRHLQKILEDLGCDCEKTFFDVPRMRSSTSDNYPHNRHCLCLASASRHLVLAPACQINWWLPIYEITSDNAMAFHPRYWLQPVKNSSADYNYYT